MGVELKNKIALITGGASGMGAETAEWLAGQGMQIAVLDRDPAPKFMSWQVDVSNDESVKTAIDAVIAKLGAIHVGINCAGIAPAKRIVGRQGPMPLADFEAVIRINLIGTFNVMRYAAAQMIQQDPVNTDGERGIIINTASIAAYEGQIGQAAYSASKGGIISLTLPAAREFSQFGIRVMAIAPGVMNTPMMGKMPAEVVDQLTAMIPFPKRLGNPPEYATLVQHIIENRYLNGSVIRLDGGMRMGSQ